MLDFVNEKVLDFSCEKNKGNMEKAIKELEAKLGKEYPSYIGGKEITCKDKFKSINPANPEQVIGLFQSPDAEYAVKAIETAFTKFQEWQYTSPEQRAGYLFRAANILRRRRFEMNACMVLEVGKSWIEADGDTAEAIDFLEFYAREILRYSERQPITPYPGEENYQVYIPIGVGIVIPPWNFPCAILVGMTAAAIVTGNTVVLKPSSDSPLIGHIFYEIMIEAGLPDGVLNFLPGKGSTIGNTLVEHPKTRFIAFTGSKEVGLGIVEKAAKTAKGQIWIKRVIAEMGGKDTIIVDNEADLDDAAVGVCASAFGFQGQKCSACSRVVVDKKVYDKFIKKLTPLVEKIKVGPTKNIEYTMGPVVNKAAMDTIMNYIKIGKKEGELVTGGSRASEDGFFIEPTVFKDIDPMAKISQEEIFGPVLAIIKANNYENALEIANNTEYGLTGSLYTRNRCKIEEAKKRFFVGNLYLNRKCTGALVGVHPFGGFNMSGTDSKAGGRDYLGLFMQAKCWSEKF
jgi:1-pyrroline-5-carboxylate dehydrogenase